MIDLDIVDILRKAADEYEALIRRNRRLDEEINKLRAEYNQDVSKIRSTPSPRFAERERRQRVLAELSKPQVAGKAKIVQPPKLEEKIADIGGLSKRASKALEECGVTRVRDFKYLTYARLNKLKNCGPTTMSEIKGLADRCGHVLK